ncbi:MAG TPA: alpha-hydroxy acid oxidase [Longimicrobiales bacterium]|nr:alpha-hydroxy acid oxidase [Longimicrobiales bacterium]
MSDVDRRSFLRWLAASPLALSLGGCMDTDGTAGSGAGAPAGGTLPSAASVMPTNPLITRPADALDVFDLERVAARKIPLAHWAYLQTGTDDEITLRRNREAFERLYIRPRRLVGVADIDTSTTLFGRTWPTPLILAPTGSHKAFHPDAEGGVARAAAATDHLFVLSNVASTSVEEVNAARGEPVWFQLYASGSWNVNEALVRRVEGAGCPALVFTVDNPGGSNRITAERGRLADPRACASCHAEGGQAPPVKPNYQGLPEPDTDAGRDALTWDFVARLRDATDMKIVLKGIMTGEDAALALRYGADGVWVSNHGGRTDPSGQATVDALPEVVRGVGGRAPVIVDSGVRRGSDVFKAIALGADAVAIGRPYIWGLGAFGQSGVERTLEILDRELGMAMRAAGTPTLGHIGSSFVGGPA